MSTLLIGHWDRDETTLSITKSHQIQDGDQVAISALFEAAGADGGSWGCTFDVDRHHIAVQRAYEEFALPLDAEVIDDVAGYEPSPS
ncbi:hypothetical protein ACIOG4_27640 [Streptomyces microflavus]|uniref:hypothetical protein n=1 Tax=Streptomyces microflavus TaxID=1919 RepID=UPI0038219699